MLRVIASIDEQPIIDQVLEHMEVGPAPLDPIHASRGPPAGKLPF
jgi:hypothetical protein